MKKQETAHLVGNGSWASFFDHNSKGLRITCNLPPFAIEKVYATCIVDFKMMKAMTEGSIVVPGQWILGYRPKLWMEKHQSFYMKHAHQIREFYLKLPKYVPSYTDLSCGHMATHYTCKKFEPKELHMYGFNSMFDFDLYSCTDFYLNSNRDTGITTRLTNRWRAIWPSMFKEFPNTEFIIHGRHNHLKFEVPDNVSVKIH